MLLAADKWGFSPAGYTMPHYIGIVSERFGIVSERRIFYFHTTILTIIH